jgi:EmrB/QacA subfamily drug resistance transporter
MAMALELFPPERRGRAMATWGMAAMAAPAIGPTLGGWLVSAASWHWLFFINVPIGIATLIAGVMLLPKAGAIERREFDLPGLVLGASGLAAGVLGLSQGNHWGWSAPATIVCIVGAVLLLVGFVAHERHRAEPLIDLRMFSVRPFRLAIGATMLVTVAQYARLVFIPLQLQSLRGYSPLDVGLLFMPAAVASAIGMHIGGRIVDRIGARRPVVIGCGGVAVAMIGFWRMPLSTPIAVILALMSLQGMSWGLTTSPALVAGLGEVPKRLLSQASAVRSLAQQVAGAVSVAALGAVVTARLTDDAAKSEAWDAYGAAYLVAAIASAAAAIVALGLPDRPDAIRHGTDPDETAVEETVVALLE